MLVLGIETSTPVSSVALWRDDGPLASLRVSRARGHVEFLAPAIDELCARAGVSLRDVDGVATGLGPGLFTSMRVGIVTAKSIAQALSVPVWGSSSLDLLAFAVRHAAGTVCACIDARRDEVFAAFYAPAPDGVKRLGGYRAIAPAALAAECAKLGEPVLLAGNGPAVYRKELGSADGSAASGWLRFPSADALCELAVPRFKLEEGIAPSALEPIYVRKTDAEINWEARGVTIERPFRVKVPKRALDS
ncbi:MAG: tRNA (adenosine(37)-N6)-threonylcarbamoyltransferase complex dimerization subunit type 1 TsaB [Actinomycetota bacterium]